MCMKREPLCILVNDLHVSKDNIPEFRKNWQELIDICKSRGIYDIVIGGDLWTSRAGQTLDTFLAVQEFILAATVTEGIYLTIAEGNHDLVDQEQYAGYSHIFHPYKGVEVIDTHKIMSWEDCDKYLAVMSYFPEQGTFTEKLKALKKNLKMKDINISDVTLYIHQGIQGGLPGGFISNTDLPKDLFDDFEQTLVGHYHNRCHVKDSNIWYIGSSRQDNFGEDEEKGYTIFYDDASTEFIKNQVNTRYVDYELDAADLDSFKSEKLNDSLYKVKLKVKCTETESKTLDRNALISQGFNKVEVNVVRTQHTTENSDISEKFDKHTISKEYVKFCDKENIDSTLGTQYLDKIK